VCNGACFSHKENKVRSFNTKKELEIIMLNKISQTSMIYVPLLREMARDTKLPRPPCRKQEFYYASRLRGDKFSKPRALISVRRWVIYPLGGLSN
jgi:hypothetical protein